jgi:hypothetical protein
MDTIGSIKDVKEVTRIALRGLRSKVEEIEQGLDEVFSTNHEGWEKTICPGQIDYLYDQMNEIAEISRCIGRMVEKEYKIIKRESKS